MKQTVTRTGYYPPSWKWLLSPPTPNSHGLALSQGSQYFPHWLGKVLVRLKVLSSSSDCDVLECGDHILSYLKSELIREFPLKPHCYLFFFFLFVVICDFIVRMSFLRPLSLISLQGIALQSWLSFLRTFRCLIS